MQTWNLQRYLTFYRALALNIFKPIEGWALTLSSSLFAQSSLKIISAVSIVSNLIYNLFLLFIGKLEFASPWIYWLVIKDRNNYIPNSLNSEIQFD